MGIIETIDKFEKELLEIVDDCMSDWSYIEKEYHQKFKELKDNLKKQKVFKDKNIDKEVKNGN